PRHHRRAVGQFAPAGDAWPAPDPDPDVPVAHHHDAPGNRNFPGRTRDEREGDPGRPPGAGRGGDAQARAARHAAHPGYPALGHTRTFHATNIAPAAPNSALSAKLIDGPSATQDQPATSEPAAPPRP